VQRRAHLVIAGVVAVAATAEWLYALDERWAWVAGVAGMAAAVLALLPPRRLIAAAAGLACLAPGVLLVTGVRAVRRIECCWSAQREGLVTRASGALQTTLADAVLEARRLAQRGAAAAQLPQPAAFAELGAAMTRGPAALERGVVVLEPDGAPYAWAGRRRAVPAPDTAELRAVITPFYVTLEARRQTASGRQAVGIVLLDAAPAVADRGGALSVLFARSHGVTLRFDAPGAAARDSDEFEFCAASCDASPVLFSVRPVPPSQGDAKLAALARAAARAGIALAATLTLLLFAAPPGRWRWLVAFAAAWAAARGLFGPALAPPALFSPATFYRPMLGEFSDSAGSLLALALLALLAAGALWRRGVRRRWWTWLLAGLLLVYAPYLVRYMGRGIAPPATGVSFGLWLSWEAALAAASMTLVLLAAALVRGPVEPTRVPWTVAAACAWAGLAGIAGLWLWSPSGAWPEWYTFLWLPALAGAIVPAPRRWALLGIATVAGTAAALVTWGAAVEGRLALAARDAQRLGREPDPLAVAELERLGRQVLSGAAPATAADLYVLWAGSPLAVEDYPTVLAAWNGRGEEVAELRLAAVDLPTPLLAALARSEPPAGLRVERLDRLPGVHYVLVAPVAGDDVITVGVGPRSRLVPASRVARFLRGEQTVEPPYSISLSLPTSALEPARVQWTRSGWVAHGDRLVDLPGGPRHVHVRVDLRGPWVLLVRGALVVLVDLALLVAAWALSRIVAESWMPRSPSPRGALASYRGRLTLALVAFFIAPVLAFAIWSFTRLGDTVRASGDLLIRQALRDAAASAGEPPPTTTAGLAATVADLGRRLDADLWTYQGGRLAGTSADVLAELGLVDPLLTPAVYRRLTLEDETEMSLDERTAGRPTLVGYRVVVSGPARDQVVLAAPQLLDDETVRRRQEDLALVLILATIAGFIAAGGLAGVTARTLAQPVAALRDAALAVGRGAAPPPFPADAPREFAPVLSAFDRMVHDVRRSQAALEEARQRTAQVLANVATGVAAVDGDLRVTVANPRAEELLGVSLEPGTLVAEATPAPWAPLWEAVREFLRRPSGTIAEREFTVAGRDIRVQLAPLGATRDGCVVALDDTTALARAARVLAWGEMARQVAHEIKNPLTPIRLGIQHLERAYGAGGVASAAARSEFERTLRDTSERILAEIDRLDTIARAFSRFGAPAAEQLPLEAVDLHALAREVVQLYALGDAGNAARVVLAGASGALAHARRDEVKEVLVNLVENSRNAAAREVRVMVDEGGLRISVTDDGRGIAPAALGRVFEPTFSTTSSGSGLGLAIARRLVESWGGVITLTSALGAGTTVRLVLQPAPRAGAR
jgi:signal transduction histidine kinase